MINAMMLLYVYIVPNKGMMQTYNEYLVVKVTKCARIRWYWEILWVRSLEECKTVDNH